MREKNKKYIIDHRHTGIVVLDIDGQLEFYRDVLGMDVYYSKIEKGYFLDGLIGEKGHSPTIYKLGIGGRTMVELLHFKKSKKSKPKKLLQTGITHLAFTVNKLDMLHKKMLKKGFIFISKPKLSDDGSHKVCFCKDRDGNFVELVEKL